MVSIRFILITLFSISILFNTYAQNRVVNGIVTTFDSIPLVGATIRVKSTKQSVITDTLGSFTVTCNSKDIIWAIARGYYTQRAKLEPGIKFAAINLIIKPGEKHNQFAIGYGKVSDRDRLNALVNLTNDKVDFSSYATMYDLIRGRFAGVQVDNGEIIVRGKRSLNASNTALIILNGMEVDSDVFFDTPPGQVKSIDIIKDGGAA
ncbi:MAG: hypothetical protein GX876_09785, partial [Bacteroidales bacterium]|nr:hypothetical protein [Bacteroidales bacterium]